MCIFFIALFSVNAQGFYLDIGAGYGFGGFGVHFGTLREMGFTDDYENINNTNGGSYELGFKIGYAPIENIPLYFVGLIGHTSYNHDSALEFFSNIYGLEIIYYPIPLLQLAGSIGFSTVSNRNGYGHDTTENVPSMY